MLSNILINNKYIGETVKEKFQIATENKQPNNVNVFI